MRLRFASSFVSCFVTGACLMSVLLLPAPARSEPVTSSAADLDRNRAAQFFRAGQDAFQRGDYAVAAHSFEQAHQLLPSGPTIYNAARAWDRLSEAPQSLAAYEEALTQADLSEAQRGHAQKRVDELHKQGIVSARKPSSVQAATPSVQAAVAPSPAPPIIQSEPSLPLVAQTAPAHRSNYLGWAGVTVAGVSAIAAAGCGWLFLNHRSDFIDGGKTNDKLRSDAVLWGKLTTVALAATLVGGGVAVWGFHTGKEQPTVALRLHGTGISLGGAF